VAGLQRVEAISLAAPSYRRPQPSYEQPQAYTPRAAPITYTAQRIGNFTYTRGSNGCMNTTQIIGTQTYTTGNCPK
jgi:hypothetical protein